MVANSPAAKSLSFLENIDLSGYPEKIAQSYQNQVKKFKKNHQKTYEWVGQNFSSLKEFNEFMHKMLAAVTLAGQIAISQPVEAQVFQNLNTEDKNKELLNEITQQEWDEVMQKMIGYVNGEVGHLPEQDELYLEQQLTDILGFNVTAELEGHRLNHSIGIMGGEQHLVRYPGDTLSNHDAYLEAGIAPARGAFGWFTEDGELTEKAIQREKYYFAVQTLYLPDWNTNYQELKPWYKFRKMIAINPAEGMAVVAVVGDAGPAMWVKKQFGGSPEVIREAKIWSPASKGRVILLFVDDPNDEVPLGPIDLNELQNKLE